MTETFPVPVATHDRALIDFERYSVEYLKSIHNPEAFWAEQAERRITWRKRWDEVLRWNYERGEIAWFQGAELNVSENCLDRHLPRLGDSTAIIWEGDSPGESRRISYHELHRDVCRIADVLRKLGARRGDRIAVYMPMVPELPMVLLACARIGAIHSVIFAGFSAQAVRDRVNDAQCSIVVTANEALRGGKRIPLKQIVDEALRDCPSVRSVVVYRRTSQSVPMSAQRDVFLDEAIIGASESTPAEAMQADDPLFILYTSGSTGKPKGVVHTQAGYLLYTNLTHQLVFDYHPGDIHFCAADVGWITGHSYIVYGPLSNGATTVLFESTPLFPDAGRYWDTIERTKATIFYTAPTAIRALAKEPESFIQRYDLSSLRVLGSVGEPINRDAWLWYHSKIGKGRLPIVDTWWQTETGGIMISPLPGATALKPGSATLPFFGVQPCVVDEKGNEILGNGIEGRLCIKFPWPGQARTVYGDHERFVNTYFSTFPGKYFTGDGCRRDEDGYYWITGRVDDVLNVSGHRIGTAELESAIVSSGLAAESAVVGFPHEIKGTGIAAFVICNAAGLAATDPSTAIRNAVRAAIGAFAAPDRIYIVPGLPKTRSGKIMRRILRKICEGEFEQIGDITTLADPNVVQEIISVVKKNLLVFLQP